MKFLAIAAVAVAGLLGLHRGSSPAVDFTRSGGFTGSTVHLVVDKHGHARVTADPGGKHRFTLTTKQRHKLTRALDKARGAGKPSQPGGCADCFIYTIKASGLSVTYDESATVPDPIAALTALLAKLAS